MQWMESMVYELKKDIMGWSNNCFHWRGYKSRLRANYGHCRLNMSYRQKKLQEENYVCFAEGEFN